MVRQQKKPTSQQIFAKNVRRLRERAGLSQEAFAGIAGVHRTFVGAVERGEKNTTLKVVEKFANALEISVLEILTEEVGK